MKSYIVALLAVASGGVLMAAPPDKASEEPKPEQQLEQAKVEQPVKLTKAVAEEDAWTEAKYGVAGQFAQAPNVMDPINPLAKPQAGTGEGNLSRDSVTGRIMGLRLIKFEF